jgi:hypothetical protein
MSNKRGRPKGTTKDDAKDDVVRFRCHKEQKEKWEENALRKGKTLTEWIIERLNNSQ